jgi:hypothetical protein
MISRRPGEPIQPGDDQRIARFQDRERLGERLAVGDGENDQLATDGTHTARSIEICPLCRKYRKKARSAVTRC